MMNKAAKSGIIDCFTSLFNHLVCEGRVPNDWYLSYIINIFKGKGDASSCGNCRALKLKHQVIKVPEHTINVIIQ